MYSNFCKQQTKTMFFQNTFSSIKDFLSIYKPFCNLCSSDYGGVVLNLPYLRTSRMVIGHFLQQFLNSLQLAVRSSDSEILFRTC